MILLQAQLNNHLLSKLQNQSKHLLLNHRNNLLLLHRIYHLTHFYSNKCTIQNARRESHDE